MLYNKKTTKAQLQVMIDDMYKELQELKAEQEKVKDTSMSAQDLHEFMSTMFSGQQTTQAWMDAIERAVNKGLILGHQVSRKNVVLHLNRKEMGMKANGLVHKLLVNKIRGKRWYYTSENVGDYTNLYILTK